jgi:putative IMPACT (imprinted ancient) family translation regulator
LPFCIICKLWLIIIYKIDSRKSIFQPHFARVTSAEEVQQVLSRLYENRKIANATHNMYAYRIRQEGRGILQERILRISVSAKKLCKLSFPLQ